jgi:hypothetical protein
MVPHSAPFTAHVVGVQVPPPPHWLATPPPPQVCGATQVPQFFWPVAVLIAVPPQPSLCGPHVPAG